jgi:SH3-like domain-containing protein
MPAITVSVLAFLVVIAAPLSVAAAPPKGSGLPVPRFVSLGADEVNLRTGPGPQYPVDWVYRRAGLPMEIVAEYRHWRKVRDWQGAEGWVHKNLLSGRRAAIVVGAMTSLRSRPEAVAPAVARVEPGVIVRILRCPKENAACLIRVDDEEGWLERGSLWGVYADEQIE